MPSCVVVVIEAVPEPVLLSRTLSVDPPLKVTAPKLSVAFALFPLVTLILAAPKRFAPLTLSAEVALPLPSKANVPEVSARAGTALNLTELLAVSSTASPPLTRETADPPKARAPASVVVPLPLMIRPVFAPAEKTEGVKFVSLKICSEPLLSDTPLPTAKAEALTPNNPPEIVVVPV